MKTAISSVLIKKYLAGTTNAEEDALVEAWYDSFDQAEDPLAKLSSDERQVLEKLMLNRIRSDIGQPQLPGYRVDEESTDHKVPYIRRAIYAAAGIAALLLLIPAVRIWKDTLTPGIIKGISDDIVVNNTSKSMIIRAFSDGSTVWLAPGSRLEYSKAFSESKREVKMTGEGFFEVTKDPMRPFVIYSGGLITRVLGTSFRIKAYKSSSSTEISVMTGKVSVAIPDKNGKTSDVHEVMLLPQENVTYHREANKLNKGKDEPLDMQIWKKASLSFDNATVSEVMKRLNKEFGVDIRCEDPDVKGYLLTADFTDKHLPSILSMMEKSLNVSYEVKEHYILIK